MRTGLRSGVAVAALLSVFLVGCGASGGSDGAKATSTTAKGASDPTTTTSAAATTTEPASATTTTVGASKDSAICVPLKKISDYDLETANALKDQAPWAEVQQVFIKDTQDVLDAYARAAGMASASLSADLTTLRTFTAPTADLARQSTDLIDLGTRLADQPNLMEAGQAGLRLDAFARKTCGFGTSAAGGN